MVTKDYTLPRSCRPGADLVVVWRVYEACNLACRFCGYSRDVHQLRRTADVEEILRFGRVLSEYRQHHGRSILITWLGGEPLAWPSLREVSHAFHADYGLRLNVSTSGLPLACTAVCSSVIQDYEQLTVSIDGLAEFHDHVRGTPGLFQRVQSLVRPLRDSRLYLRVNTVLMRGNIDAFPAFCAEMADWGFAELTFNQLGGNDRPEFYPDNRLLPEQAKRFAAELPAVRRRMAARGLRICGSRRYLNRILCTARDQRIAIDDCRPGQRLLFIDTDGTISPCSFTCRGYGVPISQIRCIEELHALSLRWRMQRRKSRLTACDDCHATHVFEKFDGSRLPEAALTPGQVLEARA